jgi:hypothetical protein
MTAIPERARLISKGIVYEPEHGLIAYTVPGMADYVRRRDDDSLSATGDASHRRT